MCQPTLKPKVSVEKLQAEITLLREKIEELETDKIDLETLLEMTTEHSDSVEEELVDKAEQVVRESERRLRLIVEATPTSIVISRKVDDIIIYANAMAGPMVGLTTEELIGRKTVDFFNDPEQLQQLQDLVENQGSADHFEAQLKTSTSNLMWVDCSLRTLEFNDEPSILGAWHNITHLKNMNDAASRFVPNEYLNFLKKRSIVDINLGDHISGDMTIMFSDIRSFTTVSENMSAKENFDFVNKYLGWVSPVIRNHGGFVVKYLGDGIHAVFPESADNALQSCIRQLCELKDYNIESDKLGLPPIKLGIGLNTGRIMVGMVGESNRLQGDAFSDHVNLTARLEGLTKFYNVSLIISADTLMCLEHPSKYHIRFLDKVQVKGKTKALDIYEVYDSDLDCFLTLKKATQQEYEEAMKCYYAQDFTTAQTKLFRVLQTNPKDKVAWRHLMEATECIESGVDKNWTGVTVMTKK
jgi:PAS domain S-box-containing protein